MPLPIQYTKTDKVIHTNLKKAGRAADRFGFSIQEHLKIDLGKPNNRDLYDSDKIVLLPRLQESFMLGI